MTNETSQSHCAHCSAKLRGTGPRSSVLAARYCMKKVCQRVKQKAYRDLQRGESVTVDERPCYHCGQGMLPRPARVTDSAIGRWCPRGACQQDRRRRVGLDRRIEAGIFGFDEASEMAILFRQAKGRRGTVACPECGLPDAVPGYSHPLPGGRAGCRAVGVEKLSPDEARFTWPGRFE